MERVTTEKISATMPADVLAMSRRAANRAGLSLSAWLTSAARRAVLAQGMSADRALLARYGYVDDDGAEEAAIAAAEGDDHRGHAA